MQTENCPNSLNRMLLKESCRFDQSSVALDESVNSSVLSPGDACSSSTQCQVARAKVLQCPGDVRINSPPSDRTRETAPSSGCQLSRCEDQGTGFRDTRIQNSEAHLFCSQIKRYIVRPVRRQLYKPVRNVFHQIFCCFAICCRRQNLSRQRRSSGRIRCQRVDDDSPDHNRSATDSSESEVERSDVVVAAEDTDLDNGSNKRATSCRANAQVSVVSRCCHHSRHVFDLFTRPLFVVSRTRVRFEFVRYGNIRCVTICIRCSPQSQSNGIEVRPNTMRSACSNGRPVDQNVVVRCSQTEDSVSEIAGFCTSVDEDNHSAIMQYRVRLFVGPHYGFSLALLLLIVGIAYQYCRLVITMNRLPTYYLLKIF